MARDLSALETAVQMVDGIEVAGQCCVVRLVVTADGTKVPVSPWFDDTKNKTVVSSLLANIRFRDLRFEASLLVVIDGGQGPRCWRGQGLRRSSYFPTLCFALCREPDYVEYSLWC